MGGKNLRLVFKGREMPTRDLGFLLHCLILSLLRSISLKGSFLASWVRTLLSSQRLWIAVGRKVRKTRRRVIFATPVPTRHALPGFQLPPANSSNPIFYCLSNLAVVSCFPCAQSWSTLCCWFLKLFLQTQNLVRISCFKCLGEFVFVFLFDS